MEHFANLQLRVYTNIDDNKLIGEKVQHITDFCNKHDIGLYSEYNRETGYIFADIIARGLTTRYCRGTVHEVKQMYKNAFKGKIIVLVEAY